MKSNLLRLIETLHVLTYVHFFAVGENDVGEVVPNKSKNVISEGKANYGIIRPKTIVNKFVIHAVLFDVYSDYLKKK